MSEKETTARGRGRVDVLISGKSTFTGSLVVNTSSDFSFQTAEGYVYVFFLVKHHYFLEYVAILEYVTIFLLIGSSFAVRNGADCCVSIR